MSLIDITREGRIARVRFDRGDGVNALNSELIEALTDTAHALYKEDELSAVVLTGAPTVFSMGYDLTEARVRDHATTDLVAVDEAESIIEAATTMSAAELRHLAVTRDGEVVGVISVRDIVDVLVAQGDLAAKV